jgi:hypothetical protein
MKQHSLLIQLPEPLAEPVRLAGILLVVQALLRLVFLAMTLLRVGLASINIITVTTAIIGFVGIMAGVLSLQRYALARPFSLVFCTIGLLFQLYFLCNIIYSGYIFRISLLTWLLTTAYIAVYAIGLVVFAMSPYYKDAPGLGSSAL